MGFLGELCPLGRDGGVCRWAPGEEEDWVRRPWCGRQDGDLELLLRVPAPAPEASAFPVLVRLVFSQEKV